MKYQRGVSLSGLLIVSFIIVVVFVFGMKVVPAVIEYYTIVKNIKAVANSSDSATTVADVRKSFDRRAEVDDIKSISSADLDVSKDRNRIVISFEYEKRIRLGGPVSLLIDFQGSSAAKEKGE
ncbi:hypothetical protein OTERR_16570 [Oryzomicrobium terrae]|uniref:Transmembrane protein n=1 Tax=Oryzomicrobium terrae TaxID=1735038 RepID=A0A5C1E8C6_9RHOO|nr:DUF4845 domain-containing protein [Oryzomicrobium terrae]QEL65133.1 hypothetical protein OTERR_16570 [Oryzomicrobium terrae]